MKPNIVTITINKIEYEFRITPLLKPDRKWSFQIEDLPPASRFSIELNENNEWFQTAGNDQIDEEIIKDLGKAVRKQYL